MATGTRAATLHIENVAGITSLAIEDIGPLTLIEGANGQGKTSVLKAVKAALAGTKETGNLLRLGTRKGTVVLTLTDKTVITRSFTPSGSTVEVVRKGRKIAKPQQFLNDLYDALSFNPVRFLTAKAKERVDMLLEFVPRDVDVIEVANACVAVKVEAPPMDEDETPLEWVDGVRQAVYDKRTDVGRALKEKQGTISNLEGTATSDDADTDWAAVVEEKRTAADDAVQDMAADVAKLDAKYLEKKTAIEDKWRKRIEDAKAARTEAETKADHATKTAGARRMYEEAIADESRLTEEREGLKVCLERIDRFKVDLLAQLPVKGLRVHNGEIFKGDVPFEQLSESERIVLALRLTAARSGDLPIVCLDGVEALSAENRDRLKKHAEKMGLQMLAARVTDDESLTVVQS